MTSEGKKNLEKAKYHLGLARQLFQEDAMREMVGIGMGRGMWNVGMGSKLSV